MDDRQFFGSFGGQPIKIVLPSTTAWTTESCCWYLSKIDKQTAKDALKNEINSLKQKLDKILEEKIKGTILRSRWYEKGERNSKYFSSLKKRNYAQK